MQELWSMRGKRTVSDIKISASNACFEYDKVFFFFCSICKWQDRQ